MATIDVTQIEGYETMTAEEKLKALETVLFGSATADARLPLPAEILTILAPGA